MNFQQRGAATVDARAGGVAGRARAVLARLGGGRLAFLPVTLRFWDGSELSASAAPPDGGASWACGGRWGRGASWPGAATPVVSG